MSATAELTQESTSRFVQAGDVKVHYNEAGTGEPVLCLHGAGPGASGWSNFFGNIGPLSEHFRVLLVDMPGWGQSDTVAVTAEPRAQYQARVVRNMLDALGIEKANLVGNSMGGAATLSFAYDYPDRIKKMVLMGASSGGPSLFAPMPTEGIKQLNAMYDNPSPEGFRRLIEVFVYDPSRISEEVLRMRYEGAIGNQAHLKAFIESRKAPPRDLSAELNKIKTETLIIFGKDDRFVPLDVGLRLLSGLSNSQLHVFNQCGHWVQFDQAAAFNELVTNFLKK